MRTRWHSPIFVLGLVHTLIDGASCRVPRRGAAAVAVVAGRVLGVLLFLNHAEVLGSVEVHASCLVASLGLWGKSFESVIY